MNSDIQQERRNASFEVGNLSKALFEDFLKRREQLKDAVEVHFVECVALERCL